MTFGSLFAGIGGIDLGLERAGMECRWQVEIEDYPRRVLEKHWPDVARYKDVRDVGAENLGPVDLIAGGFPCQDISYAGKGAGLEGERSGLWYEFARVVREMGPRYVLVENVPALLTRGLDAVLGTLAESGYDAEWDCIPAAAVGAPHRRDRAFIVGYSHRAPSDPHAPEGSPRPAARERGGRAGDATHAERLDGRPRGARRPAPGGEGEPEPERTLQDADMGHAVEQGLEGHPGDGDEGHEPGRQHSRASRPASPAGLRGGARDVAGPRGTGLDRGEERDLQPEAGEQAQRGDHPDGRGDPVGGPDAGGEAERRQPGDWWGVEPNVGRVADGVPARVDRLKGLGNAVVPQVAEWIGRRIMEADAALREAGDAA